MIKNYLKIIPIFLLTILLTGCWNYRDINRRSLELSIGVDLQKDMLEFTGELARLPRGGGAAEVTDMYQYISLGRYFEGSRATYDATVPNPDFPGAARSVVFSKKYAQTEGIESYVNRLYYQSEFRTSVLIAISKEPTKNLFSGKVKNDISIGYAIENTIKTLSDDGVTLYKTLQDIKSDIEFKDIGYLLPYINKNNNTIEYVGFAAMKDSKLIGIIKREESNGILFILSRKPSVIMAVSNPSDKTNLVSVKNSLKKRKIRTTYESNKVNVYIDLNLNSQIQYLYDIEPISKSSMKQLENLIARKIENDVMKVLEISTKELKCDIFGFARYFMADNPEIYKKIQWQKEYPKINFHVNVKNTIKNTNLLDLNMKK